LYPNFFDEDAERGKIQRSAKGVTFSDGKRKSCTRGQHLPFAINFLLVLENTIEIV